MSHRCLGCYQELEPSQKDYHPACAKKIFGVSWIPELKIRLQDFPLIAQEMAGKMSISGVQPKISVHLNSKTKSIEPAPSGGLFILKPQSATYAHLPENEDLCMHLAREYEIEVPPHGLVKTADGTPAYLVKRFDRLKDGTKLAVEDFAQILGLTREKKYSGSYERIGKAILDHCSNSYLDFTRFFERLLFCFAVGNGDMHVKNFSLMTLPDNEVALTPAYDLLSSKLVIPGEEDLSLTLNGKKNKISREDFMEFGKNLGLAKKAMENSIQHLLLKKENFQNWIDKSFLKPKEKKSLKEIMKDRMGSLRIKNLS